MTGQLQRAYLGGTAESHSKVTSGQQETAGVCEVTRTCWVLAAVQGAPGIPHLAHNKLIRLAPFVLPGRKSGTRTSVTWVGSGNGLEPRPRIPAF